MAFNKLALVGMRDRLRRIFCEINLDRAQLHVGTGQAGVAVHDAAHELDVYRVLIARCAKASLFLELAEGGPLRAFVAFLARIHETSRKLDNHAAHGRTELTHEQYMRLDLGALHNCEHGHSCVSIKTYHRLRHCVSCGRHTPSGARGQKDPPTRWHAGRPTLTRCRPWAETRGSWNRGGSVAFPSTWSVEAQAFERSKLQIQQKCAAQVYERATKKTVRIAATMDGGP